ncbi:MAG: RNA pyrophosphohydrolase [Alphaproteobacteria bacterium]
MTKKRKDADDRPYRLGVGVMLINDKRRVFVGRRNDMAGDHWQMPQGGIDEGEEPRAAALREMKEEIGTDKAEILAESRGWFAYDLPPALGRTAWKGRYRGQKQKWFAARFTGTDSDIDLETEHPEFEAWQWIESADLPRLIVPFKRKLYVDVMEEFRALLRT